MSKYLVDNIVASTEVYENKDPGMTAMNAANPGL